MPSGIWARSISNSPNRSAGGTNVGRRVFPVCRGRAGGPSRRNSRLHSSWTSSSVDRNWSKPAPPAARPGRSRRRRKPAGSPLSGRGSSLEAASTRGSNRCSFEVGETLGESVRRPGAIPSVAAGIDIAADQGRVLLFGLAEPPILLPLIGLGVGVVRQLLFGLLRTVDSGFCSISTFRFSKFALVSSPGNLLGEGIDPRTSEFARTADRCWQPCGASDSGLARSTPHPRRRSQ